ncbi:MAG: hypothetical protein N3B13_09770, partial [Deltaproteobacteria bacterium]|nr:hypothetical protein [Deltaproteobacteria bacterium]
MKKVIFLIFLAYTTIFFFSCGEDSSVTSKDVWQQDIFTKDVTGTDTNSDTVVYPDADSGKECMFPCNADEVCIDGICVQIGDDAVVLPDTTSDIMDASTDISDISDDSAVIDVSDIPDYSDISDTYDTGIDTGTDAGQDISSDIDIGNEEVIAGSASDRFLLKGLILDGNEPYIGEVYIVGDKIFCVAENCSSTYQNDIGKFTTISTHGAIMP